MLVHGYDTLESAMRDPRQALIGNSMGAVKTVVITQRVLQVWIWVENFDTMAIPHLFPQVYSFWQVSGAKFLVG